MDQLVLCMLLPTLQAAIPKGYCAGHRWPCQLRSSIHCAVQHATHDGPADSVCRTP
jgi:hypothetical protein